MAQLYYSAFTVQSGQVPSSQTDFPVLLLPTDARFKTIGNGGHVNNSSGFDLRPYSDSSLTTALTYELVNYNASTGFFEMWVKVPSLSDGYVIYMGYGDTSLTTDGSSSSTWNSNFKAAYHFKDGTTLNVNDSTSNANNLTNHSGTAAAGQIDGGVGSATNVYLDSTSAFSLGANSVSMLAWVNTTDRTANQMVVEKATVNSQWQLFFSGSNLILRGGNAVHDLTVSAPSNNAWHRIAGTITGTSGAIYIDGSATTGTVDAFTDASSKVNISNYDSNSGVYYFLGTIDEVHVLNTAVSANWITTDYNNQSAPGTFYSIGAEQSAGVSPLTPSVTDAITIGETATSNLRSFINVTDAITDGETTQESIGLPVIGADTVTIGETATVRIAYYVPNVTDAITAGEASNLITTPLFVSAAEAVTISEASTNITTPLFTGIIGDQITVSDSAITVVSGGKVTVTNPPRYYLKPRTHMRNPQFVG